MGLFVGVVEVFCGDESGVDALLVLDTSVETTNETLPDQVAK